MYVVHWIIITQTWDFHGFPIYQAASKCHVWLLGGPEAEPSCKFTALEDQVWLSHCLFFWPWGKSPIVGEMAKHVGPPGGTFLGIRWMRRSFWVASPTTRMVEAAPSASCRQGFSRWKPRCPLALQRSNSSVTRMPPARSRARTTSCASAKRKRGLSFPLPLEMCWV